MDGSQLPTESTHLKSKLVPGVSDSKMRDDSSKQIDTASKNGPMIKKVKMEKMFEDSKTSKDLTMAEKVESGTNRQSKKSSTTFRGDTHKNVENPFSQ